MSLTYHLRLRRRARSGGCCGRRRRRLQVAEADDASVLPVRAQIAAVVLERTLGYQPLRSRTQNDTQEYRQRGTSSWVVISTAHNRTALAPARDRIASGELTRSSENRQKRQQEICSCC